MHETQHHTIDEHALLSWTTAARKLSDVTSAPLMEIEDLDRDPCLWRIRRAAKAARYATTITEQPLRLVAVELAESLEAYVEANRAKN